LVKKRCPSVAKAIRPEKWPVAVDVGRGAEQRLHLLQGWRFAVGERAAREHHALAAGASLRITEVDPLFLREARVEHDVHQPTLALCGDLRHAADTRAPLAVRADEVQRARLLGDQHPTVGQEGHGPGDWKSATTWTWNGASAGGDRVSGAGGGGGLGRRAGGLGGEGGQHDDGNDGRAAAYGHFRVSRSCNDPGCRSVSRIRQTREGCTCENRRSTGEGFLGSTAATAAFLAMHDLSALAAQAGAGGALPAPAEDASGRPRLLALELRSGAPLAEMKAFYGKTLDLGVRDERADRFTVEAGETRITFVHDAQDGRWAGRLSITSPSTSRRTRSFRRSSGRRRGRRCCRFPSATGAAGYPRTSWTTATGNAHSIFFLDPAGNILEYIARHDLKNGDRHPFSWGDILYASEIGLNRRRRGGDDRHGEGDGSALAVQGAGADQFTAMGDEYGLLLLMKRGRVLDFTGNEANGARIYPTTVTVRGAKAARHQLAAYPYHVAIESAAAAPESVSGRLFAEDAVRGGGCKAVNPDERLTKDRPKSCYRNEMARKKNPAEMMRRTQVRRLWEKWVETHGKGLRTGNEVLLFNGYMGENYDILRADKPRGK
jgi:hypothetical protein